MESQIEKTAAQIKQLVGGKLYGDGRRIISGVAPFEASKPHEITLAGQAGFLKHLDRTNAGAVIVPESFKGFEKKAFAGKSIIAVDNPRAAWAKVMQLFYPPVHPEWNISDASWTGKNFVCGKNVHIAPYAFIGDNVKMGDSVVIYPHVYIGDGVVLGNDVTIYANVSVGHGTQIGDRVIIHPSTVIGGDGFGFASDGGQWEKIPQVGNVRIDDDVEIGGCCTIDRATFGTTTIGPGVKIDSHVHIAHNVVIGENSILVAQVGISGSVNIGRHVILAARAGVAQHLKIGDGAVLGPAAGVAKDIPEKAMVSGSPAIAHRQWLRVQNVIPMLPELKKKISRLESKVAEMKNLMDVEKK